MQHIVSMCNRYYEQVTEHPFDVKLKISNDGDKKANDIRIEILFPEELVLFKKNKRDIPIPKLLPKGVNPIARYFLDKNYANQMSATIADTSFPRANIELEMGLHIRLWHNLPCFLRLDDLFIGLIDKTGRRRKMNANENNGLELNSGSQGYKDIWLEEYKMMREELVNYMEKLQSVRNMMYVAIGSAFLFLVNEQVSFLCALLPLLLVISAYSNVVNYWVCVRKASAYLVVFHESYEDCPIHWESRHNMLKKIGKKKNENYEKSVCANILPQLAVYYCCSAVIILICVFRLMVQAYGISENESVAIWKVKINGMAVSVYLLIICIITITTLQLFS